MSKQSMTISIRRLREDEAVVDDMASEVRAGLSGQPRTLPSKYFYDERGSRLFDQITRLPEYYLTRTETGILEEVSSAIIGSARPDEMVELGAGFSRKTRLLIEAMERRAKRGRLVALDVSEEPLREAGSRLLRAYPWLEYEGFVGDFERDLGRLPRRGRRLVVFLGSTMGNIHPDERVEFLRHVGEGLEEDDALLIGLDLVKERDVLEAAYDDAAGVTAQFNLNVLDVIEERLDAKLDKDAFEHVARFDDEREWIEMNLRATRPTEIDLADGHEPIALEKGEEIRTEISCKFTRPRVEEALEGAGMELVRWDSDEEKRFALVLARQRKEG